MSLINHASGFIRFLFKTSVASIFFFPLMLYFGWDQGLEKIQDLGWGARPSETSASQENREQSEKTFVSRTAVFGGRIVVVISLRHKFLL